MTDDRPTIPFPPRPIRSAADVAMTAIGEVMAQSGAADPEPEPPRRRARTEIEQVAFWVNHLRHRDLKKICRDVTGDDDTASKLIDQLATWAEATVELALKDGAPQ